MESGIPTIIPPQSYYAGAEGNNQISCVAISSNKKTMAMGFKSADKPCILYY